MEIIIGAVVSLLAQWAKNKAQISGMWTILMVLVLSLAAAGLYVFLVSAGLWETVLKVFIVAGAFYTYIIQRFETQ